MKISEMPVRVGDNEQYRLQRTLEDIVGSNPGFEDIPEAYIPWPYRNPNWEEPQDCPKCGRRMLQYVWGDSFYEAGYLTRACAGPLQFLMRLYPTLLFFINHWDITLAKAKRRKYIIAKKES